MTGPPAAVGLGLATGLMEGTAKAMVAADRVSRMAAVDVGQTGSEVIYRENTLTLHRYTPDERRHETPIFVVYALINRPYILDLQPDRSVVRRLLDAGFVVYLVDWGEPSRLDTTLAMADYVGRYLDNCVDAVLTDADADDLHLFGYCMGGTMASMYTAIRPDPVRTLTCMAMPFAFDGTGGILERWAADVDPGQLADTLGNVPAELLAVEFALLNPVDNLLTKYIHLFERLDDDAFVETFARMERWIWNGVDVAGAAFREFVGEIYRENQLVDGTYELRGEPVPFEAIETPILHIVGADDDIVPPASSKPFAEIVASEETRIIEFPVGHVGLSVSSRAHAELWPEVADWLATRSVPRGPSGAGAVRDGQAVTRTAEARTAATAVDAIARHGGAMVDGGDAAPHDDRADDPVESIDGIGPTYGERLRGAGIETVADLRAADPSDLAAVTDAPASRVATWRDRVA